MSDEEFTKKWQAILKELSERVRNLAVTDEDLKEAARQLWSGPEHFLRQYAEHVAGSALAPIHEQAPERTKPFFKYIEGHLFDKHLDDSKLMQWFNPNDLEMFQEKLENCRAGIAVFLLVRYLSASEECRLHDSCNWPEVAPKETARLLLLNYMWRRVNASEIPLAVGFSDPSVFSKAFDRWADLPTAGYQHAAATAEATEDTH